MLAPRLLPAVFPARAGMNRNGGLSGREHGSVPRASGDEPMNSMLFALFKLCSPRERG